MKRTNSSYLLNRYPDQSQFIQHVIKNTKTNSKINTIEEKQFHKNKLQKLDQELEKLNEEELINLKMKRLKR